MRYHFAILPFLLLVGCAGPDENDYCRGFGVRPGDAEYARCTQYYFQQEATFRTDYNVCAVEADRLYPPSLYSRPQSFPVRYYGGYGHGFGHTQMVHVGADYQQNAEVDALRMRIIEPCMQRRGWVSGSSWQAGRLPPGKPVQVRKLPWQ